jgi:hypothetical protein
MYGYRYVHGEQRVLVACPLWEADSETKKILRRYKDDPASNSIDSLG